MKRICILFFGLSLVTTIAGCNKKEQAPPFTESIRNAEAPVKDVPKDILVSQQAFMAVSKAVTPSVVNISNEKAGHTAVLRVFSLL
jgi:serine protease Do